jgi:lincosamide nucleotidyltransferase A/C/D/E
LSNQGVKLTGAAPRGCNKRHVPGGPPRQLQKRFGGMTILAGFDPGKNRMQAKPEMTAAALVKLLHLFESASIQVWLDGGWGVDALLQTQTRPHKDVDLVLPVADVPKLAELLAVKGFDVREGKPPHSFVLANGAGLEIDVHAVTFDGAGNGVYRMQSGEDWVYTAEGFSGCGLVGGVTVRCLSPAAQVLGHAHGYVPVEQDFRDMELLAERFGVELPPRLRRRQGSLRAW